LLHLKENRNNLKRFRTIMQHRNLWWFFRDGEFSCGKVDRAILFGAQQRCACAYKRLTADVLCVLRNILVCFYKTHSYCKTFHSVHFCVEIIKFVLYNSTIVTILQQADNFEKW